MNTFRKITLLAAGTALAATLAAGVANAATVTATASTGPVAGYGVTLGTASWVPGDAPAVVSGSVTNQYKSPVGDSSPNQYFTVGSPNPNLAPSPATLSLATARDTFRMLWGSIDSYNAVLFSNGTSTALYTGSFIRTLLDPDGTFGSTNAIVTFDLDFDFTTVSFYSNFNTGENPPSGNDTAAFEFQVAAVPVPAGGLLLLGGLAGLAALRRRKAA